MHEFSDPRAETNPKEMIISDGAYQEQENVEMDELLEPSR